MPTTLPYDILTKLPTEKRLIIDASSIVKACCYAGTDLEFGQKVTTPEGKVITVNSAYYGSELFLKSYASVLEAYKMTPNQTLFVLDGHDANRFRKNIYSGYKAQRAELAPELYKELAGAIKRSAEQLLKLGAMVLDQDMTEADEIIAYLCKNLEGNKMVWSRDKDMLVLQDSNTDILMGDDLNPTISIACDNKYTTVYKALVGDSSDNLPGAKGFGDAAFNKLVIQYGEEGLDTLLQMLEDRELHLLNADEFKPFQKIIDGAGLVYLSYDCAKFYPQNVNTAFSPMTIKAGLVEVADDETHPHLVRFAGQVKLAQTAADLGDLMTHIKSSPFVTIDLETSTPPESDAWIERIRETKKNKKVTIVDVFGSEITGMGVTCGVNANITQYIPLDHLDCYNFSLNDLANVLGAIPDGIPVAIHNTSFELPVLFNNIGGWLSNAVDTQIMKAYVDENTGLGLKKCSKQYFNYDQASYEDTTNGRKMNELTGAEVLSYGADDTIVGAALYNRLKLTLEIEGMLKVFEDCELATQYWVAEAFITGFEPDLDRLAELAKKDHTRFRELEEELVAYLMHIGWKGCKFEPLHSLSPTEIKRAFLDLSGVKLDCRARMVEKVTAAIREQGQPELADLFEAGDLDGVNATLEAIFEPYPDFSVEKDAHLKSLVYDTWGLPIRFRTIPTATMRKRGIKEGNPQIDSFAIEHAIQIDLIADDAETKKRASILKVIREMKAIHTRESLYYVPYPVLTHWADGKIHPNLGQSRAATRRFTPSSPNVNQLPKKGEGLAVREIVKAPKGWFVCAMDWSGQELRLAADASWDQNMVDCYIGDNLKDPHSITGAAIAAKQGSEFGDYDNFVKHLSVKDVKAFRGLGKGVNFSSQYLCRAAKLAKLLTIDPASAQQYLDAKNKAYPDLEKWQQDTINRAKKSGYAFTRLGAKRHIVGGLMARNKYDVAKAERQALNFEIQGSAAEMTKLAITQMVLSGLFSQGYAEILFPVHDELVFFIKKTHLHKLSQIHACMTEQYADMTIPLESEVSLGTTFGTLVVVGNTPTKEAVAKAVAKIEGD